MPSRRLLGHIPNKGQIRRKLLADAETSQKPAFFRFLCRLPAQTLPPRTRPEPLDGQDYEKRLKKR
jgi:hypothetical protein